MSLRGEIFDFSSRWSFIEKGKSWVKNHIRERDDLYLGKKGEHLRTGMTAGDWKTKTISQSQS